MRKYFCQACHNLEFGIKTRKLVQHTCELENESYIKYVRQETNRKSKEKDEIRRRI
jgi:hypothetical protein